MITENFPDGASLTQHYEGTSYIGRAKKAVDDGLRDLQRERMHRKMHNQTESRELSRLYWSCEHDRHWVAYTPVTGYVCFPPERDGWLKRRPLPEFNAAALREIPSKLAFNTGFPVA